MPFFLTFADNQKVEELTQNPNVSLTTIPANGEEYVQVKHAVIHKSDLSIHAIKDKFLAKMPTYIMNIPNALPALALFEIRFSKADVVLDFEHIETILL